MTLLDGKLLCRLGICFPPSPHLFLGDGGDLRLFRKRDDNARRQLGVMTVANALWLETQAREQEAV